MQTDVVVCPNGKCREVIIVAWLRKAIVDDHEVGIFGDPILSWNLKPQSSAKPFPDYIPSAILKDYEEACLIRDLSPKASATLSRRCLQGMIRDFWGIKEKQLFHEINKLKDKIDVNTWQAIDAVRRIGNIGAHMEKDIDLIIEVEPEEAGLLLGLIEFLLAEWYVHRHEHDEHVKKLIAVAEAKSKAKSGNNP